ncbi:indole-3-glycerol phosphate synthase [Anaerocolumna cellulosilytica]|uniref:Indole-3-glycerol phosphate synthase n=1 Tax=Anaerocolumna cellulosilytica TaxID=433286 RepID=A0A6S6R002_9FIRM|nr:indole-3-glycerol phosphate synthase TrpC [Anaerocolumna cellulosilytica]MBB5194159.1 indole-3-glycerol phosphate synthase [Anaerocolumna cellulosilytica]BCJ94629.1 indole-3-glycerol phosphate synthase [Anaerocolumna cellulosilytica]
MILDKIAEATKLRIQREKATISLPEIIKQAKEFPVDTSFPFEKAFSNKNMHFICEVKKASPSKGIIADDFPYIQIAMEYESAGASGISVLTEPDFFLGKDCYLTQIKKKVTIPVLRKDFILEPYQIYQSKIIGADCILLICSLLAEETVKEYISLCDTLGLSALVEVHDEKEAYAAVRAGARIIGVNNRNLKTFEVDIHNSIRLRKHIPEHLICIAESGIKTSQDIKNLQTAGIDGTLIGETLMRSSDKKRMLDALRELL